jgi:DNA-binding PadR family transcriptional regulator
MASRELSSIALIVLGLLRERPLHPYEILRIMRKHRDDLRLAISVGSIYHAVERLEREGYVVPTGTGREGARPERTTYEITPAGKDEHSRRTRELLRAVQPEYPAFDVGLGQADALEADEVAALLRERLETVEAEHLAYRAAIGAVVARGVPRRHMLDALYEIEQRATQVAWLTRTIAEIESGELDWTSTKPHPTTLNSDDATSPSAKDLV